MNSDFFLTEECSDRRRHGSLAFVLGVQLVVDEAVLSRSGVHYMNPIWARVVNILDRTVLKVTIRYISHVGKPVARTEAARTRASDTRNLVFSGALPSFFVVSSTRARPGSRWSSRANRRCSRCHALWDWSPINLESALLFALWAMGASFFFSHSMVQRGVAGRNAGLGAPRGDVTALVDAQLKRDITRDCDPRPALRKHLGAEHSALAFVPALVVVWGLSTDNNQLQSFHKKPSTPAGSIVPSTSHMCLFCDATLSILDRRSRKSL